MKFNRSARTNQRIERISTQHIVIGIDISKDNHVAAAVTFRGIELGQPFSFPNGRDGFERLLAWVARLQKKHGLTHAIFGMESTGHYGIPLALWLRNQKQPVVEVNPMTTKRNKENRDNRPSKNDPKDAVVIADSVSRGFYNDWVWHEEIYRKLRCAVNEHEALSDELTALGNRLLMLLDQGFPEFTSVYKEWNCPRAVATLKAFPLPGDLKRLTIEQIIEGWRKAGMKRASGTRGRHCAALLLSAARTSVGITDTADQLKREIGRTLNRYEAVEADKEVVASEIMALLEQVPQTASEPLIESGLSPFLSATVLANTGPLDRYEHGSQVMALAGLNLCESTSGKRKGQIVISKRGRRQLRKYLYLAVLGLVANHEAFKAWHQHNVKTLKMKKQRSIFKLIGKLVRIIVALARSGETFEAGKASAIDLQAA